MNTKDLEYFKEIAETKSISRASRSLYISPQGLSKSLKRLEEEFQTTLLDRDKSSQELVLTETGKAVLAFAEKIGNMEAGLREQIAEIEEKDDKVVDILSAYGIIRFLSPERILEFQKRYPDIEFHYHEHPDRKVEEYFLKGYGNIALSIGGFEKEDYERYDIIELGELPVKLLVYEGHPLAKKSFVTIEDIRDEPMYMESGAFKINHLVRSKCREAGFEPNILFETSGFSLCHKMVNQKKCISVTMDFVFSDMKEPNLVKIPFWEDDMQWKICLLKRKGDKVGAGVCTFIDYIKKEIRSRIKPLSDGKTDRKELSPIS